MHPGICLGQEILDDHLLYVTMACMACGDGFQCIDPIGPAFADPDEDSGREWDLQLAGRFECRESSLGCLVGRPLVTFEVGVHGFDHHALRWRDLAENGEFGSAERAGVCVGE